MAISVVQRKEIGNAAVTNTIPLAFTSNTSNGNALIAIADTSTASTSLSAITDTQGLTWNLLPIINGNSSIKGWIAYGSAAAAETITVTTGFNDSSLYIFEVAGLAPNNAVDAVNVVFANQSSVTSLSSGNTGTLTNANNLIIGITVNQANPGIAPTAGAGYSNLQTDTTSFNGGGSEEKIVAATTAVSATFTVAANGTSHTTAAFVFSDTDIVVLPTVTTQAASSIGKTSATANGNVTATGFGTNDHQGVVYDTVSHALPGNVAPGSSGYASNVDNAGSFGAGAFTASLTSLSKNTTYFYRAYTHNSAGYSYGTEVSFTVAPSVPLIDKLSDFDPAFTDDITGQTDDFLLLEDGVSRLLLEDGTSKLIINREYPPNDYLTYQTQAANVLTSGTTYYWRVRKKMSGGSYQEWSQVQTIVPTSGAAAPSVASWKKPSIQQLRNRIPKRQQPNYNNRGKFFPVTTITTTQTITAKANILTSPATDVVMWKKPANQPLKNRVLKRLQLPRPTKANFLVTVSTSQTITAKANIIVTPAVDVEFYKQPVNQPLKSRVPKRLQVNRVPRSSFLVFVTATQTITAKANIIVTPAVDVDFYKHPVEQPLKSRVPKRQQPSPGRKAISVASLTIATSQNITAKAFIIVTPAIDVEFWKRPTEQPLRNRIPKRQQPRRTPSLLVTITTTQTITAKASITGTTPHITQFIEMLRGAWNVTGTLNTYIEVPAIQTLLDTNDFDGTVQYFFEADLLNSQNNGGTAFVQLYDHTGAAAVAGSEVTAGFNQGETLRVRSGPLSLSGATAYSVRFKNDTGNTQNTTVYGARIIVAQSGAITKTQIHNELGAEKNISLTSNSNRDQRFMMFLYQASKYDGTVSIRHDAVLKSTAANTATSGIWDETANALIAGSEVSITNNTNYSALSSGPITLVDGNVYRPTAYVSAGATVAFESSKLVFTITGGFTKFLAYISTMTDADGIYHTTGTTFGFAPDGRIATGAGDFSGATLTTSYEALISISNAAETVTAELGTFDNATLNSTDIVGSSVTATGDTLTHRVRSSAFTLPAGYNEFSPGIKTSNATATASIFQGYIVAEVTGIPGTNSPANDVGFWKHPTNQPVRVRVKRQMPESYGFVRTFTTGTTTQTITAKAFIVVTPAVDVEFYKQPVSQPLRSRVPKRQQPNYNAQKRFLTTVTTAQTITAKANIIVTPAVDLEFWKQPANQPLKGRVPKRQMPVQKTRASFLVTITTSQVITAKANIIVTPAIDVDFYKHSVEQFLKSRVPKRQQPIPGRTGVSITALIITTTQTITAKANIIVTPAVDLEFWKQPVNQFLAKRIPKRQMPNYRNRGRHLVTITTTQTITAVANIRAFAAGNVEAWKHPVEQPLRKRIRPRQQPMPGRNRAPKPIVTSVQTITAKAFIRATLTTRQNIGARAHIVNPYIWGNVGNVGGHWENGQTATTPLWVRNALVGGHFQSNSTPTTPTWSAASAPGSSDWE